MKNQLLILIVFFSCILTLKAQKTVRDSLVIDDTVRAVFITQYETDRIIETQIYGNDTIVNIDKSPYYSNFIDSLKLIDNFINRDTVSSNLDYLYVHIANVSGCLGPSYSHLFVYYNPNIKGNQKGIILYNGDGNRKQIGYFGASYLDSIVNTLNDNLAFNCKGFGYLRLTGDYTVATGQNESKIVIKSQESNKVFENEFVAYPLNFGFQNNIKNEIWNYGLNHLSDCDLEEFQNFIGLNNHLFEENTLLIEMVKIFRSDNFRR